MSNNYVCWSICIFTCVLVNEQCQFVKLYSGINVMYIVPTLYLHNHVSLVDMDTQTVRSSVQVYIYVNAS